MSALHLPTGGARAFGLTLKMSSSSSSSIAASMRWTHGAAVDRERAEWRRVQTRTACRALPEQAAAQLEMMGYKVTAPQDGHPAPGRKALGAW